MKDTNSYLMEHPEESKRLRLKTDLIKTKQHLLWSGLKQGMKVMDLGCGSGIVTSLMSDIVLSNGSVFGLDSSLSRINDSREYCKDKTNVEFINSSVQDLDINKYNNFDLIWGRFFLEHNKDPFNIINKCITMLSPGGTLAILDLDLNSIVHYPLPEKITKVINRLTSFTGDMRFDFFTGRKLYTMFYDAGLTNIEVDIEGYHCIYGKLNDVDLYNWTMKIDRISKFIPEICPDYPGGSKGFLNDFLEFFKSERRFTYTPLIKVKGTKPGF